MLGAMDAWTCGELETNTCFKLTSAGHPLALSSRKRVIEKQRCLRLRLTFAKTRPEVVVFMVTCGRGEVLLGMCVCLHSASKWTLRL